MCIAVESNKTKQVRGKQSPSTHKRLRRMSNVRFEEDVFNKKVK